MSSTSTPIPLHRFAEAITDLPLSNLDIKAAEIRNSIAHLETSNQELRILASEGDQDCAEALVENREVIGKMKERVLLLRAEVERRGNKWDQDEDLGLNISEDNDVKIEEEDIRMTEGREAARASTGRLGDEELARRLREQVDEDGQDVDGVHL